MQERPRVENGCELPEVGIEAAEDVCRYPECTVPVLKEHTREGVCRLRTGDKRHSGIQNGLIAIVPDQPRHRREPNEAPAVLQHLIGSVRGDAVGASHRLEAYTQVTAGHHRPTAIMFRTRLVGGCSPRGSSCCSEKGYAEQSCSTCQ